MKKRKKKKPVKTKDLLSTGSTLLNLACSNRRQGGFVKGKYHLLVGDSKSGKTWLSLTCLAEANLRSDFDDYRFIFDDIEGGAMMDVEKFFGKGVAERMEPPCRDEDGNPLCSRYAEEFYYNITDALDEGQPFIYVLDSMDGLTSKYEEQKHEEGKTAHRKGKDPKGSYGDNKAKVNSSNLRIVQNRLTETGSILIIINQTRDDLGFGPNTRTWSGGRALFFYARIAFLSKVVKKISKSVKGKPRHIGNRCEIEVIKNNITGQQHKIQIPIYHSTGIDDIGDCVDYLVDEGEWEQNKQKIFAPTLELEGSRESVIRQIEENELENEVRAEVQSTWNEILEACKLERKKRYQ